MKLFFLVGEASGDSLASRLINALNESSSEPVECSGIGGPLMEDQGFKTLLPMDQISIIGIWEVIPKIPHLLKIKKAIIEEIETKQPDAVITVDFPDFNFHIAKALKKRGVYKGKIIHYVAPSVWAWRASRAKKMSEFLDGVMCLFPMEVPYFTEHNLKAAHVGHPIVVSGAKDASNTAFRERNEIPEDTTTIGLFFGSRNNEFKDIGHIIKTAALLIDEEIDKIHVIAPTLPKLEYEVQNILKDFPLPVYVISNSDVKWEAIKACDFAISVSGTIALELAYAGVPHVICYKTGSITGFILKLLVKVKFAHLANILLEKGVVPEFLQKDCHPERIAIKAIELIKSDDLKKAQIEEFKELEGKLNGADGISPSLKAAKFIIETISSK